MSFISELKRRRLVQVGITYLVVAWGIAQVADLLLENFQVGDWVMQLILIVLGIGCFVAIGLAWVFDLRWDGIHLESEAAKSLEVPSQPAIAVENESIAVLPFVNMSSDPEQDYFSDGLSEELLNLLAKIPELRVAARTSAFAYKGKDASIEEIGRQLRVAHVLEGSVRKSGNKVRITAQLIRTVNGYHIWSETWDRALEDIFDVQDEIAAEVTDQLKIKLLSGPPEAVETDPEAYSLYLQARHLTRQAATEGYEQAIVSLQEALAIAPDYAPAWRQLGVIYMTQAGRGLRPVEEGYGLGQKATERALALDPNNALAHASMCRIAMSRDQDYARAAMHIEKAISLAPNDVAILTAAANLAQTLGRVDTAIALGEYIAARDPVHPTIHGNLAHSYLIAGRPEAAVASYRTALQLSPGAIGLHANLGLALLARGDPIPALKEIKQEHHEAFRLISEAMAYHAVGESEDSDAVLAEAIEKYGVDWAVNIASVYAYRGEPEKAFQWLEKALAYRDPGLIEITSDPEFASLHTDPRWSELLGKIGISPEQLAAISFEVALPA